MHTMSDEEEEEQEGVAKQLYDAVKVGNVTQISRLLLAADDRVRLLGTEFGSCKETALHIACETGDLDVLLVLLSAKANLEAKDCHGRTPLHVETIKVLLDHGAKVDIKASQGLTPVHFACHMGSVEVLRMLVSAGADVKAKDNYRGQTPLMIASCKGCLDIVQFLLDTYDGNLNDKDAHGDTALHGSCRHLEVTAHLVGRGANIFTKNNKGETPLDMATTDTVEFLLNHYQQLVYNHDGHSCLLSVLQNATFSKKRTRRGRRVVAALPIGTIKLDQLLGLLAFFVAQSPEVIRTQDSTNRDLALHVACRTRAPVPVLRFLLDQDPVILHYSNGSGSLPLHEACRAGAPLKTLQFLVGVGGGIGTLCARDHNGALPLHLLLQTQPSLDAIKFMVSSYIKSPFIKTDDGDLPIMVAARSSASESVILYLSLVHPQGLGYLHQFYKM